MDRPIFAKISSLHVNNSTVLGNTNIGWVEGYMPRKPKSAQEGIILGFRSSETLGNFLKLGCGGANRSSKCYEGEPEAMVNGLVKGRLGRPRWPRGASEYHVCNVRNHATEVRLQTRGIHGPKI